MIAPTQVPGALNLTADQLRWDSIIALANSGSVSAQTTLMALLGFLNSQTVEAPIVDGIITIDLSQYPGAVFYTTIDDDFAFNVVEGVADGNNFIWQSIGNGSTFTGDFSFARFPSAAAPIPTSADGQVDTCTFIQREDWFGFISGQNA